MVDMGKHRYTDELTEFDKFTLLDIQKRISEIDNREDLRTVHFLVKNYKSIQAFFRAIKEINS